MQFKWCLTARSGASTLSTKPEPGKGLKTGQRKKQGVLFEKEATLFPAAHVRPNDLSSKKGRRDVFSVQRATCSGGGGGDWFGLRAL